MDFGIALNLGGWAVIVIGALAFGVIAQFIGDTETGYEWLVDAVAVAIGAIVASEFVVDWRTIEPVWEGLALIPALAGGLVVGIVVEVATRLTTGGTYTHGAMHA